MKIDTQMRDFDAGQVASEAQRFENMGFDGLWTFESAHDPFLPLAISAQATKKLSIGTNISVAFGRSPFAMAQVAWDLQKGSGGRFHLGLGTQVRAHVERRFSMPFEHPAARVTDYIRCVRAIWDTFQNDTAPTYEGPYYQFKLMNPFFNPGPIDKPDIPIYLAGLNPRMCQAAGEVADGFHVHPMHSVGFLNDVVKPNLTQGGKSRGKTAADMILYAPVFAVTGDTQAQMDASEQEIRRQISFYASTPNYRALLEYHGLPDLGKALSKLARNGEWDAMTGMVPDSLMEEVAIVAKPADLGQALRKRYEGVLDRVSLYFPIEKGDSDDKWNAFVDSFQAA